MVHMPTAGDNAKGSILRTRSKHVVICVSAALLAVGCASLLEHEAPAPELKPVQAVKNSIEESAALYAIGRSHHGQMRYDEAIAAYQQLLEQDPNHAEARNALGVIYASQGRMAKAIAAIDQAIRSAPQASHLRNNLGYAYILQGRYTEAEAELVRATALDPDNARAAENLGLARSRLTSFDDGPTASAPPPPAADASMAAESPPSVSTRSTQGGAQLVVVGPNVYELRFAPPPLAHGGVRPAEHPGAAENAPGDSLSLEVSNGNGITGFARKTSDYLQEQGYRAARLTNQRPFNQAATEIQYRGGFQLQAQELKAALAGKPIILESSQLRAGVEIRVVLGRDATPATLLASSQKPAADPVKIEPQLLN